MEIKGMVASPKGAILADIGNGMYVAKANSMELAICSKVDGGYKVENCVLAGFMMRSDNDFISAVKGLRECDL